MLLSEIHCGGAARVGEEGGEMESPSVVLRGSEYLELQIQILYFAKYRSIWEKEASTLYLKIVKYLDSDRIYYILYTSIEMNYISSHISIFSIFVYIMSAVNERYCIVSYKCAEHFNVFFWT